MRSRRRTCPWLGEEILAKVNKMPGNELIVGTIDSARLRRARNLILDFRNALQGISVRHLLNPEKPYQLVRSLQEALRSKPYAEDDFMAASDDYE